MRWLANRHVFRISLNNNETQDILCVIKLFYLSEDFYFNTVIRPSFIRPSFALILRYRSIISVMPYLRFLHNIYYIPFISVEPSIVNNNHL